MSTTIVGCSTSAVEGPIRYGSHKTRGPTTTRTFEGTQAQIQTLDAYFRLYGWTTEVTQGAVWKAHFRRFGRTVYSIGGNEGRNQQSARLMGLSVNTTKVLVYTFNGFCSGLAGIALAIFVSSGHGLYATGFELNVIASVVIGGTMLTGGEGYVFGTLFGVMVIAVTQVLIQFIGSLSSWWTKIVIGLLMLVFIGIQSILASEKVENGRKIGEQTKTGSHRRRWVLAFGVGAVITTISDLALEGSNLILSGSGSDQWNLYYHGLDRGVSSRRSLDPQRQWLLQCRWPISFHEHHHPGSAAKVLPPPGSLIENQPGLTQFAGNVTRSHDPGTTFLSRGFWVICAYQPAWFGADLPVTAWQGQTMGSPYTVKIVGFALDDQATAEVRAEIELTLHEVNRQRSHYQPDSTG